MRHNTPLSLAGAEERQVALKWLDTRIREKSIKLAYEVLNTMNELRSEQEIDSYMDISVLFDWDSVGMMEALANEILLIRDLEREGE